LACPRAQDREERRWMQRQNKNFTDRIKKDERQRVATFVQLAYDNDPRVIAYKEKARAHARPMRRAGTWAFAHTRTRALAVGSGARARRTNAVAAAVPVLLGP
jgi:DnaJ family protein C protein 2